jgi:dephospho-CoA kinase
MQYIVGLTGLIGSGKSVAAKYFSDIGIDIVDTDHIAHMITNKNGIAIHSIHQEFGKEYITSDNSLNRDKMRKLIFSDKKAKTALEKILHPLIYKESIEQINQSSSLYTIVAVPLLFKSLKFMSIINRSIFVDCNEKTLIKRVISRNGMLTHEVQNIIKSQSPRDTQLLLCDDILSNNQTLNELYNNVLKLDTKYKNLWLN